MEGLPWWSSGKESAFQCRDTGSIRGQGTKIPHVTGQLSPCATTMRAAMQSPRTATKDPACLSEDPAGHN